MDNHLYTSIYDVLKVRIQDNGRFIYKFGELGLAPLNSQNTAADATSLPSVVKPEPYNAWYENSLVNISTSYSKLLLLRSKPGLPDSSLYTPLCGAFIILIVFPA